MPDMNMQPEIKVRKQLITALVYPMLLETVQKFQREANPVIKELEDPNNKEAFLQIFFDGIREAASIMEKDALNKHRKILARK